MPRVILGDCLDELRKLPDDSVDLVFCSPPYEAARTYGIGFNLRGQDWVDWSVDRYLECVRVCRGLVAWVVEGQTRDYRWSATPTLFMADLHRAGVSLRKPPLYVRDGIPGSGGPDFVKNKYEFVVCSSKGRLPWSDPCAMGHPPKFPPGGDPTNRTASGKRVREVNRKSSGKRELRRYRPPVLANPGNLINCGAGGGNHLGSKLAHENEAPFPEKLAEFFVRSFCPPGGTVLDPFCGSGTTMAVAKMHGRDWIGIDIRQEMTDLTMRRLEETDFENRRSSSVGKTRCKKGKTCQSSSIQTRQTYLFRCD